MRTRAPVRWRVELTGRAGAFEHGAARRQRHHLCRRLLGELDRMEQELKALPPNQRFDPPCTTLQVTQIQGGTATNIVPVLVLVRLGDPRAAGLRPEAAGAARCRPFAADSCLPRDAARRARRPRSDHVAPTRCRRSPPTPAPRSCTLALKLAGQNETFAVSYATEAGLFQNGGVPVGRVRPRRHRPGAHRQRVDRHRRARQVHGLHRAARRLGQRLSR